jgi:hypothetical protein
MRAARGLAAIAALAVAAAGAGAGAAQASGPAGAATAIGNLNMQRTANGIPAVTADPALSAGCADHNSYMHANGDIPTHDELATSPGFTAAGQQAARQSAIAFGARPWDTPLHNPFETAPILLAELLDPSLLVSGYNESFRFSCAVVLAPGRRPEPPAPRIYTYPGPRAEIYSGEQAKQEPFTPGELIGIKRGAVTGPYLLVFADGVSPTGPVKPRIVAASLRRAGKKVKRRNVKVRTIDSTNSRLSAFIPPGGMVIPVRKLRRGAYKAAVSVDVGGAVLTRRWRFRAV